MRTAIRPGVRHEPLGIIRNSEVHFLSLEAHFRIIIDRDKGPRNTGVMGSHVVTAVHQVVRHDIDKIDRRPDLRALLLSESDHVTFLARDRE